MKQLVLQKPGQLELRDVEIPKALPGELILKVRNAITCGTDLKTFRRGHPKFPMPTPFGHEFSGDVYEVGQGVKNFEVGQPVMCAPTTPCGKCRNCQRGLGNLCDYTMDTMMLGCFAEYIRVPAHIVKVNVFPKPDNLSYLEAAVLEPLSCIVYGAEHLTATAEDTVLIIGAGPIALLHLMITKMRGVKRIIVLGRRELRLQTARELGADVVIDEKSPDAYEQLNDACEGEGADTVIECTGMPEIWEKSLTLARPGGQVLLFGGCASGTHVNIPQHFVTQENLTIKGVFHFTPKAVRKSYQLLASGQLPVKKLITAVYPLSQYKTIFDLLCQGDNIKIGITPGE